MLLRNLVLILMIMNVKNDQNDRIIHRTLENESTLGLPIVIAYYKLYFETNNKMINYWKNRLHKVAINHKDVSFAISDLYEFDEELREYGFEDYPKLRKDGSAIVILKDRNQVKYLLDQRLAVDSLEKFVTSFKNQELTPYLKSQPIPDNEGKAVKEVVGKTFDDLVVRNKKHVLILFYAHWCIYCKQLSPIWEQLGEIMADEPSIDIVKMDATMNDVPKPFEVVSYPSIYWVPSNNKDSPTKYDGERQLYDFIVYIAQYATHQLINYDRDGQPSYKRLEF